MDKSTEGVGTLDVSGKCPCGGTFSAGKSPPTLLHSMPPCDRFVDLDPIEYLRYARQKHMD